MKASKSGLSSEVAIKDITLPGSEFMNMIRTIMQQNTAFKDKFTEVKQLIKQYSKY